jgi:hypothetical protein
MQERNTEAVEPQNVPNVPTRGRGRPKGSKNKSKMFAQPSEGWSLQATPEDEAALVSGKTRSASAHRKWQRGHIKPQFVLNRKEAYEIFFRYLRSAEGKNALRDLITEGSPGVGKLSDSNLGKYLEQTNLLSRYPHEVVIKG